MEREGVRGGGGGEGGKCYDYLKLVLVIEFVCEILGCVNEFWCFSFSVWGCLCGGCYALFSSDSRQY